MAKKFKKYTINIGIIIKNAPVEAYHSIEMIEHYYGLLKQVYSIITAEIPSIEPNLAI